MAIAYHTFAQRIGYLTTCVIPATVLSDEPLDAEDASSLCSDASSDGLSYLQVVRSLEEDVYLARVAASPEGVMQGYTVLLAEQQLCAALPLDCRLRQRDGSLLDPTTILHRISVHAHDRQPATRTGSDPETLILPEPTVPLVPVVELEVTAEEVVAVLPEPEASAAQVQRALLFLALRKLGYTQVRRRVRGEERWERVLTHTGILLQQLRRWHRRSGQRLVNIMAEGCSSWRLFIGAPEGFALARAA